MNKRVFFILIFTLAFFSLYAQMGSVRDSALVAPIIGFNYSLQTPGGDMGERYGVSNSVGATFLLKTKKNLVFGADWNYIFGRKVTEPGLMKNLITSEGNIVSKNGEFARLKIYERGFYSSVKFGRVFSLPWTNKNSGFLIMLTAGALQHKIKIEIGDDNVSALTKDYKKGYDRLTNGIAVGQFVGFLYLSKNRLVNLFCGFEFIQGFTKNRRSFNFDTMEKDNKSRLDLLSGFKVGLTLPLYKRMPQEYYYN